MDLPLACIDFEATSLSLDSFPIEVGIAIATAPGQPVLVWSTLIRPAPDWQIAADWDRAAERTHKIPRSDLRDGRRPGEVAATVNRLVARIGQAWCDGDKYDAHWLATLYAAAGARPAFQLCDVSGPFARDRRLRARVADLLAAHKAPHRAGPDAARLCSALLQARFGGAAPEVLELDGRALSERLGQILP